MIKRVGVRLAPLSSGRRENENGAAARLSAAAGDWKKKKYCFEGEAHVTQLTKKQNKTNLEPKRRKPGV